MMITSSARQTMHSRARTGLQEIVAAAAHVFAIAGFHRTQMADIAEHAGVALGTLYRHAASKEEWFARAIAWSVAAEPGLSDFEIAKRDVDAYLSKHLPTWFDGVSYSSMFGIRQDVAEFVHVAAAIYDQISKRRYAIRILDRSAHDLPWLNDIYVQNVREPALSAMADYLERMQATGRMTPLDDPRASCRFIMETCAWFAMHRLFSPGGANISDASARRTALTHLCAAFGQPCVLPAEHKPEKDDRP
jgi:AcrR family transcriptional regulator